MSDPKEPWEMTVVETLNEASPYLRGRVAFTANSLQQDTEMTWPQALARAWELVDAGGNRHRRLLEAALGQGKPVPNEVLADYPNLAAKYGKAV